MKKTKADFIAELTALKVAGADLERDSMRKGYVIAMEETGPKPESDAQGERFAEYYRARAALKFP